MSSLIGHKKQWEKLISVQQENRLHHALIFYGVEGIGKFTFAKKWIQFLFCNDPQKPCGSCSHCHRVESATHPDLFVVEPDGKSIKIDQIRNLLSKIHLTPLEVSKKIVLIDAAHTLTTESANSLLKLLEEPPAQTYFILITPSRGQLLPTIRSRCLSYFFQAPTLEEWALGLTENKIENAEEIKKILPLVDFSLGQALSLLEKKFNEFNQSFSEILSGKIGFSSMTKVVSKWSSDENDIPLFLKIVVQRLIRQSRSHLDLLKSVDRIHEALGLWNQNVQKNLLLENLMIDLKNQSPDVLEFLKRPLYN